MKPNDNLVSLAYDVVNLSPRSKELDFGGGSDYQGELCLSWIGGKFQAHLTVFSDPFTVGLFSFMEPPETHWREEEAEFEAVKIRDVADWLKSDWGFELEEAGDG